MRDCQSVNHQGPRASDETWECPCCKKICCYDCEGTADDDDPFEDSCDDCWGALHDLYDLMMTDMEDGRHA